MTGAEARNSTRVAPARLETEKREREKIAGLLEVELERMQCLTGFGRQLSVVWLPGGSSSLSGEVKNEVIYIYESEAERALNTLRHEFIDNLVCLAIRPYQEVTVYFKTMMNALIEKLGETAYLEKEKTIDVLTKLVSRN